MHALDTKEQENQQTAEKPAKSIVHNLVKENGQKAFCIIGKRHFAQRIPTFLNCDNYGIQRSSNPNLTSDDVKLNDKALHQKVCTHFKVDYLEEMDIIQQIKRQIEKKINGTYQLFYPTKSFKLQRGQ